MFTVEINQTFAAIHNQTIDSLTHICRTALYYYSIPSKDLTIKLVDMDYNVYCILPPPMIDTIKVEGFIEAMIVREMLNELEPVIKLLNEDTNSI